jgi:hypothetical protein
LQPPDPREDAIQIDVVIESEHGLAVKEVQVRDETWGCGRAGEGNEKSVGNQDLLDAAIPWKLCMIRD